MKFKNRTQCDFGFMGYTHALSAVAVFLLLATINPKFLFESVLKTKDLTIFVASLFVVAGSGLFPDFDNTKSTAISSLGVFGKIISSGMRAFSVLMFNLTKAKADGNDADPHRGFWHTLVSVVTWFAIVFTSVNITKTVKILEKDISIGAIIAIAWIFICSRLAISALFSKFTKRLKNKSIFIRIGFILFSILLSASVLYHAPTGLDYSWIAYSVSLGTFIHIMGDTMTTSGTPLFFPFKRKGKRWWTYRLLKIHAGGTVENTVFIPLFISAIIFSLIRIILAY